MESSYNAGIGHMNGAVEDSGFPKIVRLSVGGIHFATSIDTLTRGDPDSMLAAMFSGRHNV